MPCDSRGEGVAIADYAVGSSRGHLREGAIAGGTGSADRSRAGQTGMFLGAKLQNPDSARVLDVGESVKQLLAPCAFSSVCGNPSPCLYA
jgi:hypothetical protein